MQLADTKTVRNIVNKMVGESAHYTDKGKVGTRLLAWELGSVSEAEQLVKEIKELFLLAGFSNRVKYTCSEYSESNGWRSGGQIWLRINASYVE